MANLRVDLTEPLVNGMDIKFKAPCDCTAVSNMVVYAPDNEGNVASQTFVFKDAHGDVLTGLGNLFAKDVLVKVMVDTDTSSAYILNAGTNSYLEDNLGGEAGAVAASPTAVCSNQSGTTVNLTNYSGSRAGKVFMMYCHLGITPNVQSNTFTIRISGLPEMVEDGIVHMGPTTNLTIDNMITCNRVRKKGSTCEFTVSIHDYSKITIGELFGVGITMIYPIS